MGARGWSDGRGAKSRGKSAAPGSEERQGNRFSRKASAEGARPANLFGTPDAQNCRRVGLRCLKTLHLWQLGTATNRKLVLPQHLLNPTNLPMSKPVQEMVSRSLAYPDNPFRTSVTPSGLIFPPHTASSFFFIFLNLHSVPWKLLNGGSQLFAVWLRTEGFGGRRKVYF